jgi:murein DD-endopeptidase MepM/ murein hydrolase activator NlpD
MSIDSAVARVGEIVAMQRALVDPASATTQQSATAAAAPAGDATTGQSFANALANAQGSTPAASTAAASGSAGTPFSGSVINDPKLGPTTNPIPGASGGRLDQGMDGTSQTFLAPFNGKVVFSEANDPGWKGGGYVAIQSAQDPNTVYYAAEGLTPTVQVGQTVTAGQQIATPRANPYNGIVGNFEIGRANPASPGQPLAQAISNPAQMVFEFYHWLKGLGGPNATSTSNAGAA